MARTISANEASKSLGDVIDGALRGEDFIITRYGKPRVVVVDFLKYREMEEALGRVLVERTDEDPETVASVQRGLEDIRQGRYVAGE